MSSATTSNDELASVLAQLSYRSGSFTLASGAQSDFYVDVKQMVYTAAGAALLGRILCDRLQAHSITLVGGMAVGAIPLVDAALNEAARRSYGLDGFFVRKAVKGHGTSAKLDGRFDASARIALLEDVVTTGGSTLQAVSAVEEAGGKVALIVAVVDRQENDGMAALAAQVPASEALVNKQMIVAAARG